MVARTSSTTALLLAALALSAASARAQLLGNPVRTDVGVGTKAMAMGNNAVAEADDPSALFWNPAGMAFADGREIQFSLGGFRPAVQTAFDAGPTSTGVTAETQSIRIGNVGVLWPFTGRKGGVSLGLGYQSPYAFDAVLDYAGAYRVDTSDITIRNQYLAMGHLSFWTAGMGFQIAPNFSLGFALSLVTGYGTEDLRFEKRTNGRVADPANDWYHDEVVRRYAGYDVRLGLMYRTLSGLSVGMRVELPSVIGFEECGTETLPATDGPRLRYDLTGQLRSYYTGALGLSHDLPFLTVAAELNGRAPRPHRWLTEEQQHWKVGTGLGVEVPLLDRRLLVRGSYSWHEYDPNPYLVFYDQATSAAAAAEPESIAGEHTLSAGASLNLARRVSLDLSYAHRFMDLNTDTVLREKHSSQRLLASVTVRY